MRKIIGILRSPKYSPNSNDRAIMDSVKAILEERGMEVSLLSEDNIGQLGPNAADAWFSMARSEEALRRLDAEEHRGCVVVNPAEGVRRCQRPCVTRLMMEEGIPCAESEVLDLHEAPTLAWQKFPAWLKRGDACAQQREDVSFVTDGASLEAAIGAFRRRGIYSAVLSEHLTGDIVKFYGVAETPFFEWSYPTLGHRHSKFGLEEINGPAQQFPFDEAAMKQTADRLASLTLAPVYGGDAIVDSEGSFRIIDFNDWPSFSSCTDRAARAIGDYIIKRITEK
jgi:hypothetical protein